MTSKHILLLVWFEGSTLVTRAFTDRHTRARAAAQLMVDRIPYYLSACAVEE